MNTSTKRRDVLILLLLVGAGPQGPRLQAQEARSSLALEVRGAGSAPVATARVELHRDDSAAAMEEEPRRGATDSKGRLLLEGLEEGRYRIRVEADGYFERTLGGVLIQSGTSKRLQLALLEGFALEGAVSGPTGEGLEGAEVCVRLRSAPGIETEEDPDGSLTVDPTCVKSATGGHVRFIPLPRGVYTLTVAATGHVPLSRDLVLSHPVPMQAWRLKTGGSITGRLLRADGEAWPRVSVSAQDKLRAEAPLEAAHAVTDADGRFLLGGLAQGSWRVRIEPDEAIPLVREAVEVRAGEVTNLGDIELKPGTALEGRVLATQGDPVPGAKLRVHQNNASYRLVRQTTTDRDGRFRLGGLPETEVDLIVVPPKGHAPRRELSLKPPRQDLVIEVEEAGRIRGVVTAGQGVLPARVTITSVTPVSIPGIGDATVRTEEVDPGTGRFLLEGVTPGEEVEVSARAAGFWCESVKLPVAAGRESGPAELVLERGVSLDGIVTDLKGSPLSGVLVATPVGASASSDMVGQFHLDGLRPGTQKLTVSHPEFAPVARMLSVPMPDGERVIFRLGSGGTVAGSVLDQDGEPVEGVLVSLGEQPRITLTDSLGHYRIEHVPAGSCRVVRQGTSGSEDREVRVVDVVEGETVTVDFRLGTTLTGRVTRAGAPVMGAFLGLSQPKDWQNLVHLGDYSTRSTFTDEEGRFSISGVPSGWATVTIQDGSQAISKILEVPPGRKPQIEIQLPGRPVQGTVIAAGDGKPLPGARVLATLSRPWGAPESQQSVSGSDTDAIGQNFAFGITTGSSAATTTTGDGRFLLFVEEGEKGTLVAFARGYAFEAQEIDPGRTNPLTVRLKRAGRLRVRMSDPEGRPVSESKLCLWEGEPGSSGGCQEGQGSTREMSVREGRHTLIASAPGFASKVLLDRQAAVDEEGRVEEVDLKLVPGARVTFRLSGFSGDRASVVSLKDPARREMRALVEGSTVDPKTGDRSWRTSPMEKGEWEVTVDLGDGKPIVKTFSVLPGPDIEVLLP